MRPAVRGARFARPDFIDQRDAERPFAPHAERGDEAQGGDVPGLGGQAACPGKDGVGEDAERHRAHAPDFIPQPAEKHAAAGCADEKYGDNRSEPTIYIGNGGVRAGKEVFERGLPDERKKTHFVAVEQPSEKGGDESKNLAAGGRRGHPVLRSRTHCAQLLKNRSPSQNSRFVPVLRVGKTAAKSPAGWAGLSENGLEVGQSLRSTTT